MKLGTAEKFLEKGLEERKKENLYRILPKPQNALIDFASNDYLGLARQSELIVDINNNKYTELQNINCSTGSRLLTGNSAYAIELEGLIAKHHKAESALIFNSGYTANLGLFSCIPKKSDTVFYDELIHASVRDGIRLSFANTYKFKHNDLGDLKNKLNKRKGNFYIAVESIYSMDGDEAPLAGLTEIAKEFDANLIVDEAHSTGLYGNHGAGLIEELGLQNEVFARVHTYGKAMGCHGAAVVGSKRLIEYLINYSRPFIYSTALPKASLTAIKSAYEYISNKNDIVLFTNNLIKLFKQKIDIKNHILINSNSPIQCVVIPGNKEAKTAATSLQKNGFDVRAVLSPTVKKGTERLRICIHAFNTKKQVEELCSLINQL